MHVTTPSSSNLKLPLWQTKAVLTENKTSLWFHLHNFQKGQGMKGLTAGGSVTVGILQNTVFAESLKSNLSSQNQLATTHFCCDQCC